MFYLPNFLPPFLHSIKDFVLCYDTENICPLSLTLTGLDNLVSSHKKKM